MTRRRIIRPCADCETLTEYANIAALCAETARNDLNSVWAAGTIDEARRFAALGDRESVSDVERRAASILAPLAEAGDAVRWERSPVGAFPSVPDYLAGSPLAMWQRQPVIDERAERTIYICHGGDYKLKPIQLAHYGATIAALLLAMSRAYTVRARVYMSTTTKGIIFDLASPLDISEICAVFCRPCVYRQGSLGILEKRCVEARQPASVPPSPWEKAGREATRRVLRKYGANEKSVIIGYAEACRIARMSEAEATQYVNQTISAVA